MNQLTFVFSYTYMCLLFYDTFERYSFTMGKVGHVKIYPSMLHYLSVRLCWHIAQEYGPDAVITPSLWGQEIIDALLVKDAYSGFAAFFQRDIDLNKFCELYPVAERFKDRESASLSTAGFPNTITALVPSKEKAIALGQALQDKLQEIWCDVALKVREAVKRPIMEKQL